MSGSSILPGSCCGTTYNSQLLVILICIILLNQIFAIGLVFASTKNNQTDTNDLIKELQMSLANPLIPSLIGVAGVIAGVILGAIFKLNSDTKIELLKQEHNREIKLVEKTHKLESEYDLDLRTRRIESYKKLWGLMFVLRQQNKPELVIIDDLIDLKRKFTEWYYLEGGGVFLTEIDQKLFINFVNEIECLITRSAALIINEDELKNLRKLASKFRSNLLQSIGTREEPKYYSTYNELTVCFQNPNDESCEKDPYEFRLHSADTSSAQIKIWTHKPKEMKENDIEDYEMSIQIKKISANKVVYANQRNLTCDTNEKRKDIWATLDTWDLNDEYKKNGEYVVIVNLSSNKLSRQYFAVRLLYIRDNA